MAVQPSPPLDTRTAHTATSDDDDAPLIKREEGPAAANGDDHGPGMQRPAKRRKLDDSTPHRPAPRAVSPPWRAFAADGPTTVFENGVRKSSRVNKDAAPPTPEPPKTGARTPKATQTNGTPRNGVKQAARGKPAPALHKKAAAPPQNTPGARKSDRQRNAPASTRAASPLSMEGQDESADGTRKRTGRPRRATQSSMDGPGDDDLVTTPATNGHDPYAGLYASPNDPDASTPAPRLRLRLRKPDPPNRHPQHSAPPKKYASLADWLEHDDPLEGEESQRISQEKAEEEAERRLQIVRAAEHGVLSRSQCSVFAPEAAPEPLPQYAHWDHVVTHALHFNKLLREEKAFHRKMAKTVAREAYEYWKDKYKRKSQDEMDQEETERQTVRYKQLVKDVKDAWANVKLEIDKERVAKWEEEQLQLGHKAMDDMFNQAQEILGRGAADTASSFVSEDRDFDEDDFESAASELNTRNLDDGVSSGEDSEGGSADDEDADLTAEQLRAKYEQLPELSDSDEEVEVEVEEEQDEEGEQDSDEDQVFEDAEEGTPLATPDPDIDMEDELDLPENPFARTNSTSVADDGEERKPNYIDPATVELEQVDEALMDSEDEDEARESGSEAWSSDDDSDVEDESEREAGESEEDEDEEDGEDDLGMMGFLAPSDIKKLKEAAKTVVEDEQIESAEPQAELVGGHALTPEADDAEKLITNGVHRGVDVKEPHVNGNGTLPLPVPSSEATDSTPMEDVVEEVERTHNMSREDSAPPRTEVPSLLRGTLREYQHDGLDWLANLYDSDTNGILADEMGLGKTIQTISLLAHVAVDRQIWGPHLVVVPTSVMLNWEMEFKKFLPGFKILTYYGDINERKRKRMGWRNTGKDMYNVVITSYQLILQDAAAFKMRPWHYLVLDEAHNIKNFKSQRWQTMLNLRTERRLLLTGTPLQNNIDELWSLLYFLMPAGFAGEGRIAGLEEFTMALKNPTSQILDQGRQQLDAEAQKIVKKLHEVLRPYLLRRLKSEVEKQMPGKYEHVVYCKLSKRQRQLYDGFMGRATTKEILSSGNYMSIINCLMSLRKVCNHPDLFETRAIVTSMAMPKSVPAQFEIKNLLIRKRLQEGLHETQVNLDALNLVFARREQTQLRSARRSHQIRATRPLEDLIERQTRRLNKSSDKVSSDAGSSPLQSAMSAMARREQVAVRDHLQRCLDLTRARTQFMPIYGKDIIDRVTVDWHDHTFGARKEGERVRPPVAPRWQPPPQQPQQYPGPPFYRNPQPAPPFHSAQPFGQTPMQPRAEAKEESECTMIKTHHGLLGFRSPHSTAAALEWNNQQITHFHDMVPTLEQRAEAFEPLITRFTCVTPAVAAEELAPLTLSKRVVDLIRASPLSHTKDPFHEPRMRQSIAFPDKRLLQYDCGKLQRLATLLRALQAGGHRALIFTQMTKVLDILEQFLNIHGHRYLRLDGSTKIEQRQILTDRFNNDPRILAFILSSRSGGLGINLTGADAVIFYDLDWNPAMDKQCQDRAHRIGQTRDVHIYKFVSEYTIEANILRKSNQKRLLDDVIIQRGGFTTDGFHRAAADSAGRIDALDEAGRAMERVLGEKVGLLGDAGVMRAVEEEEDLLAARVAQREIVDERECDVGDFEGDAGSNDKLDGEGDEGEVVDEVEMEREKLHVDIGYYM
ncbi:hypothetical protein P153DRAFT_424126 [Dothidotthia symphoricarpi CBS 119687]|uniref:DNA helicase n=1 Tax=Dothidotthia symphoricarpi CBS 119687 TaxID=1392245 RepID=A0A6A6AAR8_9PLEO|nr:uncharacterized protein P153DRAFT_424126 [Dothidotthia symphoricarpi CBS 119687]KAF2128235.1 hypothetical protein P153DRAFT_424126 [Dothidotthia symphoricarpi CBS 119687]